MHGTMNLGKHIVLIGLFQEFMFLDVVREMNGIIDHTDPVTESCDMIHIDQSSAVDQKESSVP